MHADPLAALADVPVPGGHLGLTWSAATGVGPDELEQLAIRADGADSGRMPRPAGVLRRLFFPHPVDGDPSAGPELHVTLAGRAADGSLIAVGTVRIAAEGGRRVAAVRALVDPSWRGRGIGRALLAWQDGVALRVLGEHPGGGSAIGAPIAASMVDRRRLYTAAGFSSAARVEVVGRDLGSGASGHTAMDHGWEIRQLQEGDRPALADLLDATPDPHSFLVRGLTPTELVSVADPAISLVATQGGQIRACILTAAVAPNQAEPAAVALDLILPGGDHTLATPLLGALAQSLLEAGYRFITMALTPARAERWARPLANHGYHGMASDPLYTIELL